MMKLILSYFPHYHWPDLNYHNLLPMEKASLLMSPILRLSPVIQSSDNTNDKTTTENPPKTPKPSSDDIDYIFLNVYQPFTPCSKAFNWTYLEKNASSLVVSEVKNLPAMWEPWVQSLCQEDSLEEEMATDSSILAWRIPWIEEPGRLQSAGSQRVKHNWSDLAHMHKGSIKICWLNPKV